MDKFEKAAESALATRAHSGALELEDWFIPEGEFQFQPSWIIHDSEFTRLRLNKATLSFQRGVISHSLQFKNSALDGRIRFLDCRADRLIVFESVEGECAIDFAGLEFGDEGSTD